MYDVRKQYISFRKASVSDKQQMCFVRGKGQKGTETFQIYLYQLWFSEEFF